MVKRGHVYIVGNNKPVLYIGVTSDLVKRISQHKEGIADSFTKKYKCSKLLYYEGLDDIVSAIEREKQLKNWHRDWKMNLIRESNPELKDLYSEII